MKNTRREFIALGSMAGLTLAAPTGWAKRALAQEMPKHAGPFWLIVQAEGAWDPAFICDPSTLAQNNRLTQEIGEVSGSPIRFSPVDLADSRVDISDEELPTVVSNEAFFTKYHQRLTVINGLDMRTQNHGSGQQEASSGKIGSSYPCLAALIARGMSPDVPLAFMTGGGYSNTQDLVPLTRSSGRGARVLRDLRRPSFRNDDETFLLSSVQQRIDRMRKARLERLGQSEKLPGRKLSLERHDAAQRSVVGLSDVNFSELEMPAGISYRQMDLRRQIALSLDGFASGVTVAANVRMSAFDTHSNHDDQAPAQNARLLGGVDFAMTRAAELGIADKLFVAVVSDFGRSPDYRDNNGSGKSHYQYGAALLMGPGVEGDRVIGETQKEEKKRTPLAINLQTHATDASGEVVTGGSFHQGLRRLAGLRETALDQRYPLMAPELRL